MQLVEVPSYSSTSVVVNLTTTWQRFTVSRTMATGTTNAYFALNNSTNGAVIYIWGAQLELGSVASAYTPTTTATVTTTNNINVPSGQVLVQNGTSSLPAISFASNPTNTGLFYNSGAGYIGWKGYSSTDFIAGGGVFRMSNAQQFGFSSSADPTASGSDTVLVRDAANTLAQRNSTNAQAFRLYNTYTDASNYERLSVDWTTTANTATISTQNAGTGSKRNLAIAQDVTINTVTVGLGGGGVSSNTAVGYLALSATNTGGSSVGVGYQALKALISGAQNVAVGLNSQLAVVSGNYNVSVGGQSLQSSTASNNTALGFASLYLNTTGGSGTAIGSQTLYNNTLGSSSVGVGSGALYYNTTASNLTALGTSALFSNTTNVATLGAITGGSSYTNGTYTGVVMTLSSGSTAITYPTATIVVAGGVVTTVTLTSNGVGFKDTTTVLTAPSASIGGTGSGFSVPVATLQSGTGNVAVGYQAGYSNSVGANNTFNGYTAGYSTTTGSSNVFNGYQAGYLNTTGSSNYCIGVQALYSNSTGNNNIAIGNGTLYSLNTGGGLNVAIGNNSLRGANSSYNIGIGESTLRSVSTGAGNTAFGHQAGYNNASANATTTGSNNTYLGYLSIGSANNTTNELVIGANAVGLGSNTTVIGNSSTTLTKAFGVIVGTNYTVATLPSASTSGVGARAFVTDALAPVFGSTVATGGAVATPVYSDGTNWKVG